MTLYFLLNVPSWKIPRCTFQNSATLPGKLQACPVADLPTPRAATAPVIFAFFFRITNYPRAQWHHLLPLHLELESQIAFECLHDYWNYSMESFEWLRITAMTGGPCCCRRCQHWASRCSHPLGDALNSSAASAMQEDHLITSPFNYYW